MSNMAERPSGWIDREPDGDVDGATGGTAEGEPISDDAPGAAPEQATADGWSASSPDVQAWAAEGDAAFGFDPRGGDDGDDEAP